jgi:hypothetical protein
MVEIVKSNTIFNDQLPTVIKEYPGLSLKKRDNINYLSGTIDLFDQYHILWDTYEIEIFPSFNFPYRFPIVYETGGKIPRNIDWHIFEKTGNSCIKVVQEEILICYYGISLLNFIKDQLIPYLFNQTYRRRKGYFLNERSHGVFGPYEFYAEKLNESKGIDKIIKLLQFIESSSEPIRVSYCFCGSGKKYRKCHREAYRLLSKLGKEQLTKDIAELESLSFAIKRGYFAQAII